MSNPSKSSPAINKSSYSSPKVAKYWSTYSDNLLYGEQKIINALSPIITGSSFLDLGVGGGRTTRHLEPLVSSYLGVDYSELLVEACQEKFPDASFVVLDVCNISQLGQSRFDFAFFSFNGIDCLTASQRNQFLHRLTGVLAPGGHFLFSSHNFYCAQLDTSFRSVLHREMRSFRGERSYALRPVYHLATSLWRYRSRSSLQSTEGDCAFLLDRAQGYRELYAWMKPERQIQDLDEAGFEVLSLFSWHGDPLALDDLKLRESPSVYYLCKVA